MCRTSLVEPWTNNTPSYPFASYVVPPLIQKAGGTTPFVAERRSPAMIDPILTVAYHCLSVSSVRLISTFALPACTSSPQDFRQRGPAHLGSLGCWSGDGKVAGGLFAFSIGHHYQDHICRPGVPKSVIEPSITPSDVHMMIKSHCPPTSSLWTCNVLHSCEYTLTRPTWLVCLLL